MIGVTYVYIASGGRANVGHLLSSPSTVTLGAPTCAAICILVGSGKGYHPTEFNLAMRVTPDCWTTASSE